MRRHALLIPVEDAEALWSCLGLLRSILEKHPDVLSESRVESAKIAGVSPDEVDARTLQTVTILFEMLADALAQLAADALLDMLEQAPMPTTNPQGGRNDN